MASWPSRATMTSFASWLRSSASNVSSRSRGLSSTSRMGLSMVRSRVYLDSLHVGGWKDSVGGGHRPVARTRVASKHLWQRKMESRALAFAAFGPGAAVVPLDDPAHIGKANAGTVEFFRAMQSLKHAKQLVHVLHVKADAVILHADDVFVRGRRHGNLDFRRFARPGIFHRVRQQVA